MTIEQKSAEMAKRLLNCMFKPTVEGETMSFSIKEADISLKINEDEQMVYLESGELASDEHFPRLRKLCDGSVKTHAGEIKCRRIKNCSIYHLKYTEKIPLCFFSTPLGILGSLDGFISDYNSTMSDIKGEKKKQTDKEHHE